MHEKLKHTFALSDRGARDMVRAFLACIMHNLSLIAPVALLYNLIGDLLEGASRRAKVHFISQGLSLPLDSLC